MSAFMRKFVILEEQPDYYKKVQGVTPKGHMNIEVRDGRGKLIVNVENLKVAPDEEKLYKACLVGLNNKDYVDVDLGVIVLNDKGRGSIEWKFDPTSVGGTSLSIDKFNNILVKEVDLANEGKDVVVPLSGYIYKKDGSLVKLMKKQLEKESSREQEIQKQKIEEAQPVEPKVDNEENSQEIELKEDLLQPEIEAEQIQEEHIEVEQIQEEQVEEEQIEAEQTQEDTYVPSEEEVNIEENIEENIETTSIEEEKIEPANIENTIVEEQEIEEQEQEVEPEEIPIESQEGFKPIGLHTEGQNVEDLFFEDIVPIDLGLNNFDQGNIDVEYEKLEEQDLKEMEYSQEVEDLQESAAPQKIQDMQGEIEEQAEGTGTIWIDLETGEEVEEVGEMEEEDDLDSYFIHLQNNQVTYNYGDYIDNTYGNKIDPYMDTLKNYSMQVANYTMDILKFFDKVEPFSENLRDCTWWRIEHNSEDINRGFLPFYNYLINVYYQYPLTSRTTTCQSMIEKYGHYIFGTVRHQDEVKYYVYGVPGEFTIADHPYNGATGFNTWLKDKNSSEDLGYWLLYIDALSGKIVNPVNPTIPTR